MNEPEESGSQRESTALPRWIPVLIGAVLVTFASLAIITGIRYRNDTRLASVVRSRKPTPPPRAAVPLGEPEAGASLVFPGAATPEAGAPVQGRARAVVTGDTAGISATVRIWARRGMTISATPPDAVVAVNDLVIGEARQFDSPQEVYDFPQPGSYTVRVSAPGFREQQFLVTAADTAPTEVARIVAKLVRQ